MPFVGGPAAIEPLTNGIVAMGTLPASSAGDCNKDNMCKACGLAGIWIGGSGPIMFCVAQCCLVSPVRPPPPPPVSRVFFICRFCLNGRFCCVFGRVYQTVCAPDTLCCSVLSSHSFIRVHWLCHVLMVLAKSFCKVVTVRPEEDISQAVRVSTPH